jgi:hypothetical protein
VVVVVVGGGGKGLLLGSHCDKEVVDKDHLNNHYLREDA